LPALKGDRVGIIIKCNGQQHRIVSPKLRPAYRVAKLQIS
jgi:hypothetical protein